jgi:hypothetical protein
MRGWVALPSNSRSTASLSEMRKREWSRKGTASPDQRQDNGQPELRCSHRQIASRASTASTARDGLPPIGIGIV